MKDLVIILLLVAVVILMTQRHRAFKRALAVYRAESLIVPPADREVRYSHLLVGWERYEVTEVRAWSDTLDVDAKTECLHERLRKSPKPGSPYRIRLVRSDGVVAADHVCCLTVTHDQRAGGPSIIHIQMPLPKALAG